MKDIKKKKIVIVVLVIIGIIFIGLGIYLDYIKKDDNIDSNKNNIVDGEKNNNSNNNENEAKDDESILEVYESSDKKYKLTIIDKNNKDEYNKAKKEFSGELNNDNSDITYGYLNNEVIRINDVVKEDDTYAIVRGEYLPSVIDGMCGSTITIMYNKKTKELEIPVDAEDKFYLCVYDISFEKINDIYYFLYYYVDGGPDYGDAIYNDKWIKLGYAKRNNIKSDNDGIYVYENKNLTGDLIKYDNNGNKKINDSNSEENDKKIELTGNIDDCTISTIKDVNIVLKNTKNNNDRITSDVYINNKFSSSISYYSNPYNECDWIRNSGWRPDEIDNNYLLISFANEAAMEIDFYLFNKNGKFITDFEALRKKYDYYLSITKNDNGGLLAYYHGDNGRVMDDEPFTNAYCNLKRKPTDAFLITEHISIVNDELKVDSVEKITWEEAYLCKDGNTEDCGDINDIVCDN